MKKILLTLLLMAGTFSLGAAQYDYLVFTLTDGSTKAVAASNLTVTFNDGNLIAMSGSETLATLPLTELTQMEFSNGDPTGIVEVKSEELRVKNEMVNGQWYDMSGRQISVGTSLPRGMYIVKTKSRTVKVYIK